MTIEEKAALAIAFGVRPEFLPDELAEVDSSGGYTHGLVTWLPAPAPSPAQREAEVRAALAARYGVLPQYVELPQEAN